MAAFRGPPPRPGGYVLPPPPLAHSQQQATTTPPRLVPCSRRGRPSGTESAGCRRRGGAQLYGVSLTLSCVVVSGGQGGRPSRARLSSKPRHPRRCSLRAGGESPADTPPQPQENRVHDGLTEQHRGAMISPFLLAAARTEENVLPRCRHRQLPVASTPRRGRNAWAARRARRAPLSEQRRAGGSGRQGRFLRRSPEGRTPSSSSAVSAISTASGTLSPSVQKTRSARHATPLAAAACERQAMRGVSLCGGADAARSLGSSRVGRTRASASELGEGSGVMGRFAPGKEAKEGPGSHRLTPRRGLCPRAAASPTSPPSHPTRPLLLR